MEGEKFQKDNYFLKGGAENEIRRCSFGKLRMEDGQAKRERGDSFEGLVVPGL